jgi:hypothetical protein
MNKPILGSATKPIITILGILIGAALSTFICANSEFVAPVVLYTSSLYIPLTLIFGAPIGAIFAAIIVLMIQNKGKIPANALTYSQIGAGLGAAFCSSFCIMVQFSFAQGPMRDADFQHFISNLLFGTLPGLIIGGILFAPYGKLANRRAEANAHHQNSEEPTETSPQEQKVENSNKVYRALPVLIMLMLAVVSWIFVFGLLTHKASHPSAGQYYYVGYFVYFLEGDYEAAIAEYEKSLELDPNLGYVYLYRGLAYYELGNHEAAFADWNQAEALGTVLPLNMAEIRDSLR